MIKIKDIDKQIIDKIFELKNFTDDSVEEIDDRIKNISAKADDLIKKLDELSKKAKENNEAE